MTDDRLAAVLRYTAFTQDPRGGNPAGVVLDAGGWSESEMQRVAAEVGYSETAFVVAETQDGVETRYFSPAAEVPFCGHATIALAVALAERRGEGKRILSTRSGPVPVLTARGEGDMLRATLTSVAPRVSEPEPEVLKEAMGALGWTEPDLHRDLPPRVSYAGASHLILVAGNAERLEVLEYEYEGLKALMDRVGWTTIHLAWPKEMEQEHIVRNAFPAGPVREDPATGAAAAAYSAYLRHFGAVTPPVRLTLRQGEALGRPSTLFVDIPEGTGGIRVSGNAVPLPAA